VKKWLAIRKKAGRRIDPETAEVTWIYAQTLDPYGIEPDLPEECYCIGREYFARSPGSDIWVCFGDLPAATRDALWEKHKASLVFATLRRDCSGRLQIDISNDEAAFPNVIAAQNQAGRDHPQRRSGPRC
jgi:hypothetical protein